MQGDDGARSRCEQAMAQDDEFTPCLAPQPKLEMSTEGPLKRSRAEGVHETVRRKPKEEDQQLSEGSTNQLTVAFGEKVRGQFNDTLGENERKRQCRVSTFRSRMLVMLREMETAAEVLSFQDDWTCQLHMGDVQRGLVSACEEFDKTMTWLRTEYDAENNCSHAEKETLDLHLKMLGW